MKSMLNLPVIRDKILNDFISMKIYEKKAPIVVDITEDEEKNPKKTEETKKTLHAEEGKDISKMVENLFKNDKVMSNCLNPVQNLISKTKPLIEPKEKQISVPKETSKKPKTPCQTSNLIQVDPQIDQEGSISICVEVSSSSLKPLDFPPKKYVFKIKYRKAIRNSMPKKPKVQQPAKTTSKYAINLR